MRVKSLSILALVLSLLVSHVAPAQTPSYISDLAPYEVRALEGSYTPTNGKETINSILSADWIARGDIGGTIVAWSGGYKAITGTILFQTGGGHNDSANNGRHAFDFAGTTAPTGWVTLTRSAVADIIDNAAAYADGLPTSIHTYDGCVHASHNNHLYNFMGSHFSAAGGHTPYSWKYNIGTNTWTRLTDWPGAGSHAPLTIYNAASGKIFVASEGGGASSRFFDTADDTWGSAEAVSVAWSADMSAAWDSTRGRGVAISGTLQLLVTIDWAAETADTSSITPTGDTEVLDDGISIVYDENQDVYWLFGGQIGNEGYSSIYEMDPVTWAITEHPLTGDTFVLPPEAMVGPTQGSFGRWVYMSDYRAIGFVTDYDEPAYVIRLPGEADPPDPPGGTGSRLRMRSSVIPFPTLKEAVYEKLAA